MAVRCLIVDDNARFAAAARAMLHQEGMLVVGVASTGDEAVRSVGELRPDVTLVDIDLDGESGFDVARRLAEHPDLHPGVVIMISAHDEGDFADLVDASPAVGFLGKPVLSAAGIQRLLRAAGEGG